MGKKIFFILLLTLLNGCAYSGYLKDPFDDIPVFDTVDMDIYRGGYPKEQGYSRLKELKIRTLISFAPVGGRKFDREQLFCRNNNIEFISLPMDEYTWPDENKVKTYLMTVLDDSKKPVFIHCINGRGVTGAMTAVYRTIVQGKGPKEGYREAIQHGMWAYKGETVLKDYIHRLKDRRELYEIVR